MFVRVRCIRVYDVNTHTHAQVWFPYISGVRATTAAAVVVRAFIVVRVEGIG